MTNISTAHAPTGPVPAAHDSRVNYLFGPLIDFICIGGGSLLFLFPMVLAVPEQHRGVIFVMAVVIGQLVNNPHFMHSYQIFYDDFGAKAFGHATPRGLRIRYIVAGIVVPAVMGLFFAYSIAAGDPAAVALGGNAMVFLVGWHYVKQGYGILIVESVMKRRFLNETEKTWFRYNGFAVWWFAWIYANITIHETNLYGLKYYSLGLPHWLAYVSAAVMAATTLTVIALTVRKGLRDGSQLPWNGLCAYVTASYVSLVALYIEPALLVPVPIYHSLQYNAVVWRYQINKQRARFGDAVGLSLFGGAVRLTRAALRVIRFVIAGMVAGALAFWVVPILLTAGMPYDREVFGGALFLFIFLIFINVHHFFLDNVMWRKENPDIKEHLFTPH